MAEETHLQDRLAADQPKKKIEKMVKMRFKPGVGAHYHQGPNDERGRYLKPGEVIDLPERCLVGFGDKFEDLDAMTPAQQMSLEQARKIVAAADEADRKVAQAKELEEKAEREEKERLEKEEKERKTNPTNQGKK